MAQTYKQIQKQIEQLQKQADVLRKTEVKGVIERIKVAIAHYGLTAAHLGLESRASASKKTRAAGSKGAKAHSAFADGSGNSWSGRGPRPRWLREALASGRSLDEFRTGEADATQGNAPAKACAEYVVSMFSDYTRYITMQNLFHDGGFSFTGIAQDLMDDFKDKPATA